jgi:hypothetical protein
MPKKVFDDFVRAELDTMRAFVGELHVKFAQAENQAWVGHASRKQLIAEALWLLANNHKGDK